jgi:hypothetical protein
MISASGNPGSTMRQLHLMEYAICEQCHRRYHKPIHRGRMSGSGIPRERKRIASSRYCSPACRQRAYIVRRAIRANVPQSQRYAAFDIRHANDGGMQGTLIRHDDEIDANNSAANQELTDGAKIGARSPFHDRIVPDRCWPGMYRLRLPGGRLSNMVNRARALDACAALARAGKTARRA